MAKKKKGFLVIAHGSRKDEANQQVFTLFKRLVVVGSVRLLSDFVKKGEATTIVLKNNYQDILEKVDKIKEEKKVVFLVSGDPLFHSLGESIIERFGKEGCEVIPGISSFQYAFCQMKESWKDYRVFSLHGGKEVDMDKIFRENKRLILLLDPEHNLKFVKGKMESLPAHKYTFHVEKSSKETLLLY